jgi:branched-chain amino acid transport system permease protein
LLGYTFTTNYQVLKAWYVDATINLWGFYIQDIYVFAFLLSAAFLVGLYWLVYRTGFGRKLRASMQNPTAAALIGINVPQVQAITYGIGTALAASGGMAFGATSAFNPASSYDLIYRLLVIIVLGGLGSLRGALIGSLLLVIIGDVVALLWSPVLIYASAAVGWNLFSGYTGYISIGHAVYFGLGAYTLALACQHWNIPGGYFPFLPLPLPGLVAAAFALVLGAIILRTRRYAFSVTTIAFMFIFQLLAYNLRGITNGSAGLYLPVPLWSADTFDLPFYYVAFALVLIALFVSWRIRHSKYGLGLLAIRYDEDRALGLGVKTGAYKLAAYVVSAFFVGMAGAMFGYFYGVIYPQFTFDPIVDVQLTTMAFLGGLGTLPGPLIGAVLVAPLQQWLTLQFGGSSLNLVLFGAFLLVVLLFLPRGIVPSLQRRWLTWKASHPKGVRVGPVGKEKPALANGREGGK